MPPTIFLFLGFPGTGKYTTAIELIKLLTERQVPVKLIDNHRIANILFDLIVRNESIPLPQAIFPKIREMNIAVIETIRVLSPTDWSFVFTHYLIDTPANRKYVDTIRQVAIQRNNTFLPIVLRAEPDEVLRRIPSAERYQRQKLVDINLASRFMTSETLLIPDDAIHIDVTIQPATETAKAIINLTSE